MLKNYSLAEITLRDPFILPVAGQYYLYGTTDKEVLKPHCGKSFEVYQSLDLINWQGPHCVFENNNDFWADSNFWAPEIFSYQNQYFMFATFTSILKGGNLKRGTQVLKAKNPKGPFIPITKEPLTPSNWQCLDGSLYVDSKKIPYLIFCREWLEVKDGQFLIARISDDLKELAEEPLKLFSASEIPWATPYKIKEIKQTMLDDYFVSDGPFVYQEKDKLFLLFSSYQNNVYTIGYAIADNIYGPWHFNKEPLFAQDGGHGMIFKTFENQLMLAIHSPNTWYHEKPKIIPIKIKNDYLKII